jgi:hypothetical protein
MNWNDVLFRISNDTNVPLFTRRFANVFRCIIVIKINSNNNKRMAIFSDLCEQIIIIYYHRLIQVMVNTIDPITSRDDYEELKEIVHSMHEEIKTNNNPKLVHDRIEKQIMNF